MPQRDETFEICVVLTTWLNYDCLCHIPLSLRVLFISLNIREDKMMTLKINLMETFNEITILQWK